MASSTTLAESASNEGDKTSLIRPDTTTSYPLSTKIIASSPKSTDFAFNEVGKMAIFVPSLSHEAAAKSKGFSSTAEEEDKAGWPCRAAFMRGEDDDVEESDSGYGSSGDAPSKPLTKDETDAIKYRQLPFRQKHYLLTYIQRILEETCVRYARKHHSADFTNPIWRMNNLLFRSNEYQDDRFVNRDWLAEDQIELKIWMETFRDRIHGNPKNNSIFRAVVDLRDAAVHRGILEEKDGNPKEFYFEDLSEAMQLPSLLKDAKADSDISNAFRCIMEDSTLDEEIRAATGMEIFTPTPCTTRYQFLARIQTMLEETCFNTAARKIPDVLRRKNWHCHEQLEIKEYDDIFHRYGIQRQNHIFPQMATASQSWGNFFSGVRIFIRNVAHHRLTKVDGLLTEHGTLIKYIHLAITMCILQGDWNQAIEIEILAEIYLTKKSRDQVLERLESVYRVGSIESVYERKRRSEIAAFLARMAGREVCEGDAVVLSNSFDVIAAPDREASWEEKTWSPSMHGELKNLDEVGQGSSWVD